MTQTSPVLHHISPSAPRRIFGTGMQVMLGALLIYVALSAPEVEMPWRLFMLLTGSIALVAGVRAWRVSEGSIVMTKDGLFDHTGRVIAAIDEIKDVDRALFAFKPSNGFLLRMTTSQTRAWAPGMWWRVGKRVGIGGVTGGRQTKIVADALATLIAQRDGTLPPS